MDLRQPFCLEFAPIAHRSVAVAVKLPAADRVPVVDVIVHFANRVVGADAVGKSKIDRGRAGWVRAKIRRETTSVASDWRSQSAASNLRAGGRQRHSACS